MAYTEHKCAQMPTTGVHVNTGCEGFENFDTWGLSLIREATGEDLERDHYLEEIGNHIWSVTAEIAYCPYCGQKLRQDGQPEMSEGFYLYTSTKMKVGRY